MEKSQKTRGGVSSLILAAAVFLAAAGILPAAPPVDINTAGAEELQSLPGIGPKTVEALKHLVDVSSGFPAAAGGGPGRPPPSGPRDLKCWRCGHAFRVEGEVASGTCPSCGASWLAR